VEGSSDLHSHEFNLTIHLDNEQYLVITDNYALHLGQ
jgi:hypothetical protein